MRPAGQFTVGVLTVILLALFIFSNTNGDITVQGDDVWMITHSAHFSWNYLQEARNRGYLTPFYMFVFDINGQSTQRTHLFFFWLLALSGLLFYVVLHKILGVVPAVVGAIFYLGYVGKFETVTWMAAGAYLVCANVLFLSVWIALSGRIGPWAKGGLIAVINWLAVLLYEILMVAAPLYPLLYWLHHRLRRRRMAPGAFAATFLPLLMFLGHVSVIYLTTPKNTALLWQRGSDRSSFGQLGVMEVQLWNTLKRGFSAGFGPYHLLLLTHEIVGFWRYVPRNTYTALAALGVCAGAALLLWVAPVVRFEKAVIVPLVIAGVYLALLSPLIGFTTNPGFMPSRLVTLVGVGLALLTATAVSVALASRFRVLRYGIPAMMLAVGGMEAAAMNSILYEHQTAWAYDSRIRAQLLASGIKPRMGDTIFISLPRHPLDDYWKAGVGAGFSQFEDYHIQTILAMDYGLLLGDHAIQPPLVYQDEVRRKGVPPVKPVGRPGHQLFCFTISDNDFRLTRTDCGLPGQLAPGALPHCAAVRTDDAGKGQGER
jgi:hypothetical protein